MVYSNRPLDDYVNKYEICGRIVFASYDLEKVSDCLLEELAIANEVIVTIIPEYKETIEPEIRKALDDYLDKRRADHEVINNDSPVFRANYCIGSTNIISSTSKNLGSIPAYLQKKAGLRDISTKKWGRFPIQRNHGFRHRFDEVIKSVIGINIHLVEKMFAHTSRIVALDAVYNNPKIENSFREYKKIIHLLTIDQTEVQKIKIQQQNNMIDKFQIQEKEIEEKDQRLERVEALLIAAVKSNLIPVNDENKILIENFLEKHKS